MPLFLCIMQCGSWETMRFTIDLLHCSIEIRWSVTRRPPRFRVGAGNLRNLPAYCSGKMEAVMELQTRLNVLAAIISFAFLTAVVFGMF
jgi:hypothetical protein